MNINEKINILGQDLINYILKIYSVPYHVLSTTILNEAIENYCIAFNLCPKCLNQKHKESCNK